MSKAKPKPDTASPQPQTSGAATNGGAGVETEAETEAPRKSKALYRVGDCPVLHDHEVYQPGDELELTEAEAARLGGKVTVATT